METMSLIFTVIYHFSYAFQTELLALRRAHLEISHQLETSHEEIRGLSLRLQENVSGDGKVELYKTQNSLVGAI